MRRLVIIPLLVCLVIGVSPNVFAQEAPPGKTQEDNGYAQISIFAKALELVRQDYVDGNKTSYHDLMTAAMKGMLSSLDPHSQFMDPNDFRDMQDDTRSRFNGLGIEVSMKNGLPTVITAMEDTPAAKAGIPAVELHDADNRLIRTLTPIPHGDEPGRRLLLPDFNERELRAPGDAAGRRAGHPEGHVPPSRVEGERQVASAADG